MPCVSVAKETLACRAAPTALATPPGVVTIDVFEKVGCLMLLVITQNDESWCCSKLCSAHLISARVTGFVPPPMVSVGVAWRCIRVTQAKVHNLTEDWRAVVVYLPLMLQKELCHNRCAHLV